MSSKDAADAELFLYPGSVHLFTDSSLTEYDESATALVLQRSSNSSPAGRDQPPLARNPLHGG